MKSLPAVKQIKTQENSFWLLPFDMRVLVEPEYKENVISLLGCFFPQTKAETCEEQAHIEAYALAKEVPEEAYHLEISTEGIRIGYRTYLGIRNALATVAAMAVLTKDGYEIPCAFIDDEPALGYRGVMIDLARGIRPLEVLFADMILAAKAKLNYVHFHINDTEGVGVQLESMPRGCYIENCYSKEQMKEVFRMAEVLGFEIIPEFDVPAHGKSLVSCVPEFACDTTDENTKWTVCAGTESVYPFIESVINEIAEFFPCNYIHIGGDELEFTDVPEIKQLCHWMTCSKCRKKMEEEGLKDQQELYYYVILRVYEYVKKTGKTMIMWSDQIDCMREKVLPDDIVMHFWRVAGEGRGPVEGCSMNAQLKMGYRMINSVTTYTYISSERPERAETIADWRWDKIPQCDPELAQNVFGSEICAWEYGNRRKVKYSHYDRTFAPAVTIMGDKHWNGTTILFDEEYERGRTKAILGPSTPEGLNLFQCIGSVVPPKGPDCAYYDSIRCGKEEIEDTLALLSSMEPCDYGSGMRKQAYQKALREILEKLA